MYKILRSDRDTYITNRVISGAPQLRANVGAAGTLDLFKLYGATSSGSSPNLELSRLLLHFDLDSIRDLVSSGKVDVDSPSFECRLVLRDVYGGQTTPINFTVAVYPLSRSFEEGVGRDIVYFSDEDVSNFLTGSRTQGVWLLSGCGLGGGATSTCDFVTASVSSSLRAEQLFTTGEEDLDINVTDLVKAMLDGTVPDEGFRISLDESHETDERSYFVKRFSSRTAYDQTNRPELIVKFDDSIQDDTQFVSFDDNFTMVLYNYSKGSPSNLMSASSQLTGSNCVVLKMATEISGGWYNYVFTGSQHGSTVGVYSASVNMSSQVAVVNAKLVQSGATDFVPIWGSLDGTVGFLTGTRMRVKRHEASMVHRGHEDYVVTAYGLNKTIMTSETPNVRVNVFDQRSPLVKPSRVFSESPGVVVRDAYYSVRNIDTGKTIIPFDTVKNSTRLSSDARGMWFTLDAASLPIDQRYAIDIKLVTNDSSVLYQDASSIFRVAETR